MIGNVSFLNKAPNSNSNTNNCPNTLPSAKITFGNYSQQSPFQGIKDTVLMLTGDLVGLAGFNTVLWMIQKIVNNDILIGKINNHFTNNIKANATDEKLGTLAGQMTQKHGLLGKLGFEPGAPGKAFYTHEYNKVVVGPDQLSSLFHEIGHAVEENNTTFWKYLQRGRGHYTALSLALYTLLSQRQKNNNDSYINKTDAIIPLLAFSPELLTEARASKIGLKFLKEKLKAGEIEKSLYKNIKRSYITCFGTYLFIPVSIILLDLIRNGADNARRKRMIQKQNQFYA